MISTFRPRCATIKSKRPSIAPRYRNFHPGKVNRMSTNKEPYVSERALSNLNTGPLTTKLHAVRSHCFHNQYDPITNPDGIVALAIAENKLMRREIVDHINNHMNITPWHLTYGHGPAGSI